MNRSADQFRGSNAAESLNGLAAKRRVNHRPTGRRGRKLQPEELAFAEEGLREINRLVDECEKMTKQMDELEPRFKEAAMQKAWIVLMSFIFGSLILMFSFAWSGLVAWVVRAAIVCLLIAIYCAPVHYFVGGELRADARLVRRLDRESLSKAKRAARVGQSMNKRMRKRLGIDRERQL